MSLALPFFMPVGVLLSNFIHSISPFLKINSSIKLICACCFCGVLSLGQSHAQSDSTTISKLDFVKASATYRSGIIEHVTNVIIDFNLLVDSLKKESMFPEKHEAIREFVTNAFIEEFNQDKGTLEEHFKIKNYKIEPLHLASYFEWFKNNYHYLFEYSTLVDMGFIEKNYPYKLKPNEDFWEEIQLYGIKDGMTLVDIGTGTGFFPFLISLTGVKGEFYLTEIQPELIYLLNQKLENVYAAHLAENKMHIKVIEGSERNAMLGNVRADKIFMRETFHHFTFKKEMIQSLKRNLKPGGMIYVVEAVKELVTDTKEACKKIIFKHQIITEFEKNGYTLEEEIQDGQGVILKFSLAGPSDQN